VLHPPAERTARIASALTLETVARAAQLKAEGKPVLSLSVGEPDFDTPLPIREAGKYAIDHGITRYTEGRGLLALRKAISEKLARDQKLHYAPDQIIASCGGKHAITNFLLACINPGDEVILPAPYFLAYPELIRLAEGVPVIIETEPKDRYLISPAQLERAITPRTKMVVLITPSNPASTAYTRQELEALAPVLIRSNAWIMSDEVYEHLLYDGRRQASPAHLPELYDRTIRISSCSKTYAMTGWRLGWGCGPKEIVAAAAKLQSNMTSAPSAISQHAAIEAVSNDQKDRREMCRVFQQRRDVMFSLVRKWPHVEVPKPEGAFYVFPRIDGIWKAKGKPYPGSLSVARQLLEEQYVATMAGAVFGDDRAIRLSFAASFETIAEGCNRIEKSFEQG
jgi:aspartate aminotransferase